MLDFKPICDEHDNTIALETSLFGQELLSTARLNKGCAFTREEREVFCLTGLLPYHVETLEQQVDRVYVQYNEHHTNLGKNIYLSVLHDYNETLFYKLVSLHLEEMLPIVYTPTVGEAVQKFSLELRKPKGLYISYPERHYLDKILENRLPNEVDLVVVTDGEAVLGIGDQGIGGINISLAKLMVYSLCGGINPHRVLPVQLDVGTNNTHLLNDPMYLGWRHERIGRDEYDSFIDQVVSTIQQKFPQVFLHWEDVGRSNARRILNHYQDKICTFNGDIQATGVVALACVLAGVAASDKPLSEHCIVIYGAGTAGVGIADQIYGALLRQGLDATAARKRFWLLDKNGLLLNNNSELLPFQRPYARDPVEIAQWDVKDKNNINLLDVVSNIKASILIGASTATGAFNETIVKTMAANTPRPIILPLSNPNSLSEATPTDLLTWTEGKAIIATGSPFENVFYDNKWYRIAQSNNAFAFPGIGLGAIAVKAKHITNDMLWAATQALANCSPIMQDKMAPLLPKLAESKMVSMQVALAVMEEAKRSGLAQKNVNADFKKILQQNFWEPRYYPYRLSQK